MYRLFTSCLFAVIMCFSTPMSLASVQPASELFEQAKSYHDGVGVARDYAKAREAYLRAVSLGNTDAMLNLGYMYFVGEGVETNYAAARAWYKKAAGMGNESAKLNLDMMDARGLGMVQAEPPKVETENAPTVETPAQPAKTVQNTKPKTVTEKPNTPKARTPKAKTPKTEQKPKKQVAKSPPVSETIRQPKPQKTAALNSVRQVQSNRIITSRTITPDSEAKTPAVSKDSVKLKTELPQAKMGGIVVENIQARFSPKRTAMIVTGQMKNMTADTKSIPNVTLSVVDSKGDILQSWSMDISQTELAAYQTVELRQNIMAIPTGATSLKYEIERPSMFWRILGFIILASLLISLIIGGSNWAANRNQGQTLMII